MDPSDAGSPEETAPTAAEAACFEAGIKFGTLYHQFAGTPVSPDSAESLARAIEQSVRNQPYCSEVSVSIDAQRLAATVDEEHGYAELSGELMTATVVVEREGVRVVARMALEDGYPLMRIDAVER